MSTKSSAPAKRRAGPVDPRLLRLSPATRRWVIIAGVLTALKTLATVAMGLLIGQMAAGIIEVSGSSLPRMELIALAITVVVRGLLAWAQDRFAQRASSQVTVDLREKTLRHLAQSDPRTIDQALWRTRLTSGLDGLGPYLTGFLPALAATIIATPVMLAVVGWLDVGSMVIAIITLPLIPVFMWLVGTLTAGRTEQRLSDLAILGGQLLDLIAGLPTLRAFRRHQDMAAQVTRLSSQHASSTLSVLKIAFLSSFVLEFLATLSVALVAVGIGFRLLAGDLTLAIGLTVLIIIPEVYAPIREVGTRFHDAQDGLVATDEILKLLSVSSLVDAPTHTPRDVAGGLEVSVEKLRADGRDGPRPADLSFTAKPGQLTVLWGPNGSGKSTALLAVLGLATEGITGEVSVKDASGQEFKDSALWEHCAYLPQRPVIDPESVSDYAELSLGQRQRLALKRELGAQLLLLDEPTAHLDPDNAAIMIQQLQAEARRGTTVLAVSHDPLLRAAADEVVEVK
ncbi:ABC-type putative multidrug/protein/lipid transporter, ATPase and permease subunit [Corynebacterium glutamicum MB001]|uniref:ABC-type transporter, ATPase component and permease component n=1 Tax=Corynebacterium glutamicum (strain ATCC 13032 / DSM 20300 / JCM 1318 / BCRC 11384 / CCUG 27702 / LMG 3730 / NBRC 12168 / NCIMB 10025 / NRRL B-2784 / 534) TaxID=196627 RepID=Q8NRA4_CORGL|nr:ABC transporter ATP-binding protein/permease [Corynebacterium glutamicum]AGT05139.1 ABC-type putative multidrug/protein/lipid transporter, ATPase and permease subunit [Corynebacterium glutamicum MB001]NII97148.1 ATP-binding cassette subfamily C protein CydD [Corynebacterium glutamicum]QYO73377.1 ABC-type putative multidrug/protein/lipid transporter, ATPase and permease subunit [Corynebacterium glutamicum]WBG75707.1 ABC transporter ATP-binding protein/permease [Corynebacterium glutamicum]CAF